MRQSAHTWFALFAFTALAAAIYTPASAATHSADFMRPLGPIADMQRTELIWATVIVMVAILPVFVGVPWILWRYRRSNDKSEYAPAWHFDTKLELVMWGVPAVIIVAFGIWLTQAVFRIDPYRTIDAEMAKGMNFEIEGPPVVVDVVGLDWKWLFIYPDEGVASVGEMVIPVGRPVSMRLTTDTVMQSFMAPGLAGQIYAMPGAVTRLNVLAERQGTTVAENTQYNGTGFARQRAPARAVTGTEFSVWVEAARGAPPLDDETYALLAKSGDVAAARRDLGRTGSGPLAFALPDPMLFGRIVGRYRTGAPVPPEQQPGSHSYDPEAARLPATDKGMSDGND